MSARQSATCPLWPSGAWLGIVRMVWKSNVFWESQLQKCWVLWTLRTVPGAQCAKCGEEWKCTLGTSQWKFVKAWKCLSSLFEKFGVGQDGKCNSDQFSFCLLLLVIHLGIEYIASADIGESTSGHLVFASPIKKSKSEPWTCFTKKTSYTAIFFPKSWFQFLFGSIWVFPKVGVPQNGWFVMKTLFKNGMIWGYHYFWKQTYATIKFFVSKLSFSSCEPQGQTQILDSQLVGLHTLRKTWV